MRPLTWSRLRGTPGLCAILPSGEVAYVRRAQVTGGWRARIHRRAGDGVPVAHAIRPTQRAARAWVEDLTARRSA